jgi:hypothetical protein
MGIEESIEKAARNAVEDLAGTALRTDDGHVPDPGDPKETIRVHSSISEGSNASDTVEPGEKPPGTPSESPQTRPDDTPPLDDPHQVPAGTPGPAGLPEADPGDLRADPSEADGDPTTSMGRG